MKKIIVFLLALTSHACIAQDVQVYPPSWWVGMKTNNIQLLIRSTSELAVDKININHPGITITGRHSFENRRYAAIDISISDIAQPGQLKIDLDESNAKKAVSWILNPKKEGNGKQYAQGVTSSEFIDLLITDRFSNGDPTNDQIIFWIRKVAIKGFE